MANITLKLDPSWNLTVHAGDELTLDTPIASIGTEEQTVSHLIPVSTSLKFPPEKIFKHLNKTIGQNITKGDVIASKDGVFSTRKFISEFTGTITAVNHHKGEVTIEEKNSQGGITQILAQVKGKISKIEDGTMTVKIESSLNVKSVRSPKNILGAKVILTDAAHAILLTLPEVKNSVIVMKDVTEYVISKLEALGASYIISKNTNSENDYLLPLEDSTDETLNNIIEFAPKYIYAQPGNNELTFYKS